MELVELDIGNINLYEKRMTITAKGNHEETKFLNTQIRRELERYLKIRRRMVVNTKALFLSTRNQRISSRQVQRSLQLWLAACGIKKNLTIHSLRHTFASNLYERTNNLVLTQNALGHRNIATTTIYTHLHNNSLVEALEAI
jgi:integrase/recombinase XerC